MVANPLNNANNHITNLFAVAQDGDQIYRWDPAAQDFQGTVPTYSSFLHAWDSDFVLSPGEGIFYLNAGSNATNTFVGDVVQGPYFVANLTGGGSYNAVGSSVPLGGSFTNSIAGLKPQDGDQVYTWDTSAQDFGGTVPTYSSFLAAWDVDVTINAGIGFMYLDAGTNTTWNRSYTVPQ